MWMYIGHLCRWLIVTYCRPVGGCWHLHRHHCPAPLHHLILIHEGSTPHHISEGNGNHTQLLSPCGFLLFVNFCAALYLFNAFTALCRLQRTMCPWFDFSCQHCMYLLVYIICFPTYPFSSLFPYLLPYLSFPLRIDPLRFLARCHKRRLNWTSVHFFWLVNACFCYVRFSFFSIPSQAIGLGKRLQNSLFCVKWDVKPQLTLSLSAFTLSRITGSCIWYIKSTSQLLPKFLGQHGVIPERRLVWNWVHVCALHRTVRLCDYALCIYSDTDFTGVPNSLSAWFK